MKPKYLLRYLKYIWKRFWYIIIALLMVIIFLGKVRSKTTLDVFTQWDEATYTQDNNKETEKEVKMKTYENSQVAFAMQIPEDWEYVKKSGQDTFVHSPSASSLQIQVVSYYPQINNISADEIAGSFEAQGYTVTEFSHTDVNRYYVIYQKEAGGSVTDYIQFAIWDRDHIVKVTATFQDKYYEKLKDQLLGSLGSLTWDYEDPIPDGTALYYMPYGDFEFAVPSDWYFEAADSAAYAYNEQIGASLQVQVVENPSSVSDVSQIEYNDFLGSGKNSFAMTYFDQVADRIYAEAAYVNSTGIQMYIHQYYLSNGMYHYLVTYEYPAELSEDLYQAVTAAITATRSFYKPEPVETENATEAETGSKPDPSGSDSGAKTYHLDMEEETEAVESVSTFADALCMITDMTKEQAEEVTNIWYAIGAGNPTDAKGYKQSDTDLILQIRTGTGEIYYIYLLLSDMSVEKICLNAEDGPVVYQP